MYRATGAPPERQNKGKSPMKWRPAGQPGRARGRYARAAEQAAAARPARLWAKEADYGDRRRSSATAMQTLRKGANMARTAATNAGNGIARWFGVVDSREMQGMKQNYVRRKMTSPDLEPALGFKPKTKLPIQDLSSPQAVRQALKLANNAQDESSSDESDDERQIVVDPKSFTRDLQQGLAHYRKILKMERQRDAKPGWFGGEINRHRKSLRGYRTVRGKAPIKKKHTNVRDKTLVQLQLHSMSTFYPYFIYSITSAQFIIACLMCVHAFTIENFAAVGLASVVTECDLYASGGDPMECPLDFAETRTQQINKTSEYNWSIGPTFQYLMNYGAKFTPCMRIDTDILLEAARKRSTQCVWRASIASEVGYQCDESLFNSTGTNGFACCYLKLDAGSERAGMTSFAECQDWHAIASKPWNGLLSWKEGNVCDEQKDFIKIRPCCIGIDETCEMLTEDQCAFKGGSYREDKLLCADTMCLENGCTFFDTFDTVEASESLRNVPDSPNQWYRFALPLFIHGGLLHAGLACTVQYYAGKSVETQAGFLRTVLIYFISGVGGNIISGIFSPKTVSLGADPAVYGLLGVMIVELFQAWQIILSPVFQLAKLLFIVIVSLLIGTFPYVDNWSHVGGFFFGIVSGVVFLPYITFGQWDARRKKILLIICMPLLIFMILTAFLTFYLVQNSEFCTWCKYLNCIPYTDDVDCSAYY